MTEQFERFLNSTFGFLNRCGDWFLLDRCLAYYVCNGTFDGYNGQYTAGVLNFDAKRFLIAIDRYKMGFKQTGKKTFLIYNQFGAITVHLFNNEKNVWKNPSGDIHASHMKAPKEIKDKTLRNGLWAYTYDEGYPYEMKLPYSYGTILDNRFPLFWQQIRHAPAKVIHQDGEFFKGRRKENAIDLIKKMHGCADRAGIGHAIWPGFGTLLGIVMINDFLPNDHDMDMCFQADMISGEQEQKYLSECDKINLFKSRRRGPTIRNDTSRYLWLSLGEKNVYQAQGCKSCNWFCFEHNNYLWHTKGGLWISQKKFDMSQFNYQKTDQAVCKGLPASYFKEWTKQQFHGITINVPARTGSCCDYWYPGWFLRKNGATSRKRCVMVIGKWRDKKTWRMV